MRPGPSLPVNEHNRADKRGRQFRRADSVAGLEMDSVTRITKLQRIAIWKVESSEEKKSPK